ncbi:hypothetical protein PGA2_71p340 (plasmid) [Phaeobacter inhibens 2.10]|nr:hypothetical protein PGA2_71p340 [Phaeobacter inhibens 2.10]
MPGQARMHNGSLRHRRPDIFDRVKSTAIRGLSNSSLRPWNNSRQARRHRITRQPQNQPQIQAQNPGSDLDPASAAVIGRPSPLHRRAPPPQTPVNPAVPPRSD